MRKQPVPQQKNLCTILGWTSALGLLQSEGLEISASWTSSPLWDKIMIQRVHPSPLRHRLSPRVKY